jgi:hypothetical protein
MLRSVLASANSYSWMNAAARGPGVLDVGAGGGGEGEASSRADEDVDADGIRGLVDM